MQSCHRCCQPFALSHLLLAVVLAAITLLPPVLANEQPGSDPDDAEIHRMLNEESPSTLWYDTGAASSLSGLGPGQIPAHYHHYYYDGPAPHAHHASRYDEHAAAQAGAAPHFDEGEVDPRAARRHPVPGVHMGGMEPRPPAESYHDHLQAEDDWVHYVPQWMVNDDTDAAVHHMAAGNTAQQRLRRQQKRRDMLEEDRKRAEAEQHQPGQQQQQPAGDGHGGARDPEQL